MRKVTTILAGAAVGVLATLGAAQAGPCTDQLNEVARTLANNPAMGAPTSGALAGAAPGAIQNQAPAPKPGTPEGAIEATGEAKVTGQAVATTMAGNAPGSQDRPVDMAAGRATSPQDVRLQQTGQPTVAQGGDPTKLDDRATQAKNALEKARLLDAQGSQDCMAAIDEAKRLAGNEQ
jgi:hypothetical protein